MSPLWHFAFFVLLPASMWLNVWAYRRWRDGA